MNFFYSPNIKMTGKNIIFDHKKINKRSFYKNENYSIYMI